MKAVISKIAKANNDNGWPLGMLEALHPKLGKALCFWSAGGYEEIRQAQESGAVKPISYAAHMEAYFPLLPRWRNTARHFSKDPKWLDLATGELLELKSFMSCCSPGFIYAYANPPRATLNFAKLKSARLLGALSKENLEGEVLLPRGAVFRVVSVNIVSRIVLLEEECPNPALQGMLHLSAARPRT
jgi:hypothetical protein